MSEEELRVQRDRLIEAFKNLPGFEGCGLRKTGLCVLVKDERTKALMPSAFNGVDVEVLVTGGLRLLGGNQ